MQRPVKFNNECRIQDEKAALNIENSTLNARIESIQEKYEKKQDINKTMRKAKT